MQEPQIFLLGFLVRSVLPAEPAVLVELQLLGRGFLVFRGGVVALFALGATKGNDVSGHLSILSCFVSKPEILTTLQGRARPRGEPKPRRQPELTE
jgi:hypothetical protein